MLIARIPGKLEVVWREDVKAVVDTWASYSVTLEEFRDAVLVKGVDFAKAHDGVAWIVDSSQANGVFSHEIQNFIDTQIFNAFLQIGIQYFIAITSRINPVTKMTVKTYSAKVESHGLHLVEVESLDEAVAWLKAHV